MREEIFDFANSLAHLLPFCPVCLRSFARRLSLTTLAKVDTSPSQSSCSASSSLITALSFSYSSFIPPVSNSLLELFLRADAGKTAAQRGSPSGQLVHLFVEVSGRAVFAGTATLSENDTPGETFFRRRLRIQGPPCLEKSD